MVGSISVPLSYLHKYRHHGNAHSIGSSPGDSLVPVLCNQTVGRQPDLRPVIVRKEKAALVVEYTRMGSYYISTVGAR